MATISQHSVPSATSTDEYADNRFVSKKALHSVKSKPKAQTGDLPFVTFNDLHTPKGGLTISLPTNFRHVKTVGKAPLPSTSPELNVPNFSRPRARPQGAESSLEPSRMPIHSPCLSYYVYKTLDNAPEPFPSTLAHTVTNAMTTNNRLSIILNSLEDLHYSVQKKLDRYLNRTRLPLALSSKPTTKSTISANIAESGLKRGTSLKCLLSHRKRQRPQPAPTLEPRPSSPDPAFIAALRADISRIEQWGVQVQAAKGVLKRQMAEASQSVRDAATQQAKGAFIASGLDSKEFQRLRRTESTKSTESVCSVDIGWVMAGAEEFIAEFESPRSSPLRERERTRSATWSILSTWSEMLMN